MSKSSVLDDMLNKLCPATRINEKSKCTSPLTPFYERQRSYLASILKDVVIGNKNGLQDSTSVIVFGPPGCGKTTLIEGVVANLHEQHEEKFFNGCEVVRLNGYICSTWKKSVREICHQLKVKSILKEDNNDGGSDDLGNVFILLKESFYKLKKAVVFILDNLELFVDGNQILLYNLFDLSSINSTIHICVIGLTCRVDVLELFEKRVKSRFSHRQINLVNHFDTFENYSLCAKNLLEHPKDGAWNLDVLKIFESDKVKKLLKMMYFNNKSLADLVTYLYTVLLVTDRNLKVADFQTAFKNMFPQSSKVQMVLDLAVTDLLPLIAIYKNIQSNTQRAMKPKDLYSIVAKISLRFGLKRKDFMNSVSRIHELKLIETIESTRRVGEIIDFDTNFKTNISYLEFREIWSTYPNLPTDYLEIL